MNLLRIERHNRAGRHQSNHAIQRDSGTGQHTPGILSLALLVIEGIIGFTLVNSRLDAVQQFNVILIMAALFMAVILVVAYITVKYPLNLMDKVNESLGRNELMEKYLESDAFRDTVADIVDDIVKRSQPAEEKNGSE